MPAQVFGGVDGLSADIWHTLRVMDESAIVQPILGPLPRKDD